MIKRMLTFTNLLFCICLVLLVLMDMELERYRKVAEEQKAVWQEWYIEERQSEKPIPESWNPEPLKATELSCVEETETVATSQPGKVIFKKIKGCPWSTKTQKGIWRWCKKYSVCFELIMSMAKTESNYNAKAIGDKGQAYGAWQIHPAQWDSVIKRLGYTKQDMFNPVAAGQTCAYIMRAHFQKYPDTDFALMAWNGGGEYAFSKLDAGEVTTYAKEISKRSMRYERKKAPTADQSK